LSVDPITLEVVRNALASVAEEMGATLRRTAYSPNIKEREDCSCAIFDGSGRMVAQAEHIPVHLGSMPASVRAALDRFPPEKLEEGDIIIVNDPFFGGTHLPDITLISPVFYDGELVGMTASRAHHADVGGKAPGSMPGDSRDIFQEGIRIPPIKLFEGDEQVDSVMELILSNVRTPEERKGDLRAQVAANKLGTRRIHELIGKYGLSMYLECLEEVMNYSERRMRVEIGRIPDGTYGYTDYMDDDGSTDEPVKISVEITVDGSDMIVDFSGSDKQRRGNINAVFAVTLSCVYFVLRCVTDPTIPPNDGCYRPLRVIAPKGTVVNAEAPAAVSAGNVETSQRIVDVLLGALAKAVPERVTAGSQGTMNNISIGGRDHRSGKIYTYYETIGGGQGAGPNKDGIDGIHTGMTNTMNTPIEALEIAYPFLVKCYTLMTDTGGAGKYRGGLGIKKDIQLLAEEAELSIQSERRKHAPWGLYRGMNGAKGKSLLIMNGKVIELPSKISRTIKCGNIISIQTPGGGGYGHPLERDPELVLRDVLEEKVSLEMARELYGVIIKLDEKIVDLEGTRRLREKKRLESNQFKNELI